jgi:hypothetical protein
MKKEFVPYKLAVKLKELGFDEEGFGMYNENGEVLPFEPYTSESKAILFQQAFRWFREKHNLHAEITWSPSYEYEPGQWSDVIYEITIVNVSYTKELEAESPDMQRANGRQLTYEGAELACLEKMVEILKTKQQEQ